MVTRREDGPLAWQSKVILLLVLPWTAGSVILQSHWWLTQVPVVAYETLGISAIFGLIVWRMRAGTPGAAFTGALITASLMYSTAQYPYTTSWLHGGLMPLLAVFLLTYAATKVGRSKKERLGTGESKRGRNAAQVAANLGAAALPSVALILFAYQIEINFLGGIILQFLMLASLAEAAADTVSSEIGQVLGGRPRMLTTFRRVELGTDGAISFAGTLAGILAAGIVALIGVWTVGGGWRTWATGSELRIELLIGLCITIGGTGGLFFDSLLGATLERKGWLNNDAVNFLSTMSAPFFATVSAIAIFGLNRHINV